MKKNLLQTNELPKPPDDPNNKYFKVFYSKDINKKKKVYSEGVLAWENKKIKLYNEDGEVLVQINEKTEPEVNEEYVVGYKFAVLVDSAVEKEAFTSGRVFISLVDGRTDPAPQNSNTLQTKQLQKGAQKKGIKEKQVKQQQKVIDQNTAKVNPPEKESTELENGLSIQNIIFLKLREHQIQGVQFMYDCLMGFKSTSISGCILADFMGLGKTLQTITLIYSLLKMKKISKCIVISPLTLVYVWQKECKKWLQSKLRPLIALGDGEEVKNICKQFANNQYRMLVLSYEGFYRFIDVLENKCDLIVFDQGHRLKNKNSKAYKKILNFSCRKRVLLTGTPLQNNLQELYTCISIVNPSMFPSQQLFNNVFQKPILNGMAKKATKIQRSIAIERTIELANKIKEFSLRRKADTLEKYLPIKREYFVLFKLTPLQKLWYERLLKRKETESDVLGFLNLFRKLFTHPQILKTDRLDKGDSADFLEESMEEVSYKMNFVLNVCMKAVEKDEKVIVVSYFTSTLDFIGKILRDNSITFVKLDGKVDGKDREVVVNSFEKEKNVLLLSGKAGGTGLTLVTAKTMVILEPDWNPSNDAQVIGRIWRQGQTQEVSIYRLVIISSFEERIIERQQLKNALSQKLIDESQAAETGYDFMDMKQLFVQPSEKSIFFKENENVLDKIYLQSGLSWQGVIMVACKMSHNAKNVEGTKEEQKQKDQNNEFADGMLLFEGFIQNEEEQKSNEEEVKKSIFENQHSVFEEETKNDHLPTKVEEKVRHQVIVSKEVEVKKGKSRQKLKKSKKCEILDLDEYRMDQNIKKWKENEKLTETECECEQSRNENESLNTSLGTSICNPKSLGSELGSLTVPSEQRNSEQEDENEKKSKKGHSLVLKKLKLKKKAHQSTDQVQEN